MTRLAVLGVTGAAWAVMMAGLVTRELVPYFEYQEVPTYRALIRNLGRHELIRRGVFEGPDRVGEALTLIHPGRRGSSHVTTFFSLTLQRLPMVAGSVQVRLRSEILVDASYQLESFRMDGSVLLPVRIEGRRRGDVLEISGSLGGLSRTTEIPYDKGMVISGSMMPQQGIGRPKVGAKWRIHTIDLDVLGGRPRIATAYASIEEKVLRTIQSQTVECYRIGVKRDVTKELYDSQFYVNEAGVVVLEEFEIFKYPYRVELEELREPTPDEVSRILAERDKDPK